MSWQRPHASSRLALEGALACAFAIAASLGCRRPAPPEAHVAPEPAPSTTNAPPPPAEELLLSWKAGPLRALSLARGDVLVLRGSSEGESTLVAVERAAPHAVTTLGTCNFGGAVAASDAEHALLGCPGTPKEKLGSGWAPREADGSVDLVALTPPHRGERTRLLADVAGLGWVGLELPLVVLVEDHALTRVDTQSTPFARAKWLTGGLTSVRDAALAGSSAWLLSGVDLRRVDASGASVVRRFDELTALFAAFPDGAALVGLGARLGTVTVAGELAPGPDLGAAVIDATLDGERPFALTREAIWCGREALRAVKRLDGVLDAFDALSVDGRDVVVAMRRAGVEELWRFDRAQLGCDR